MIQLRAKGLPKTIKHNWRNYSHSDDFGYEWIDGFLADSEDIQVVFKRKHLMKTLKRICVMSCGFHRIMEDIGSKKTLLQKHASTIIEFIEQTAGHAKIEDFRHNFLREYFLILQMDNFSKDALDSIQLTI